MCTQVDDPPFIFIVMYICVRICSECVYTRGVVIGIYYSVLGASEFFFGSTPHIIVILCLYITLLFYSYLVSGISYLASRVSVVLTFS